MGFRRILSAWLATLALATGAHAANLLAAPAAPRAIAHPVWVSQPTAADIAKAATPAIAALRESARAVTECRVDGEGRLQACAILAEYPKFAGVGDAALKLMAAYRMASVGETGASTAGGVVAVPVEFSVPGQSGASPALAWAPAQEAYLVNRSAEGSPVGRIVCPTAAEPRRKCYLHPLQWSASPDFIQRAVLLRRIGRTEGRSLVECAVDAAGALVGCDASADMVAPRKDALFTLLSLFRAPATSTDDQPLASGRVLIAFDWEVLSRAANTSALTRPPPAVSSTATASLDPS
jgi:hypothetical protein